MSGECLECGVWTPDNTTGPTPTGDRESGVPDDREVRVTRCVSRVGLGLGGRPEPTYKVLRTRSVSTHLGAHPTVLSRAGRRSEVRGERLSSRTESRTRAHAGRSGLEAWDGPVSTVKVRDE